MAVVELGPIVQSVRGSLGGVTFRQVGSRCIASGKSAGPVSPGKNSATHVERLKSVVTLWRSLDAPVKEFWTRWHTLDKPLNPDTGRTFATPYHAFAKFQYCRSLCLRDPLLDRPPTLPVFSTNCRNNISVFKAPGVTPDGIFGFASMDLSVFLIRPVVFGTMSRNPWRSRYPRLIYPQPESVATTQVLRSNAYIWQVLGIPPGISELVTQTAPPDVYFWFRGWAENNDVIYFADWAPPAVTNTQFFWPPQTPSA